MSSPLFTTPYLCPSMQWSMGLWSPSTVTHQNHIALRNKTNSSVPPSLLTIEHETTVVNYRINKRIPKAISTAWQISKHIASGQEGDSHPDRIASSLLGTIYLMQMKTQTFIYQLNKKLRGRASGTWKKIDFILHGIRELEIYQDLVHAHIWCV